MRRYAIIALLFDLDDPRRGLGHLRQPLLVSEGPDHEGYVPNLVYSCGSAVNGNDLVLPYGLSDAAIGIAIPSLAELQGPTGPSSRRDRALSETRERPGFAKPHSLRPGGPELASNLNLWRNLMNNLMLTFSATDLSRLRTLVAAVEKEIALIPTAPTTEKGASPRTALETTWSRLVEMLDLGSEPEMRTCPECKHLCMLGATRCGHCWAGLPSLESKGKVTA